MNAIQQEIHKRVEACLGKSKKLTMGEVEMLRAMRERSVFLSFLEEQELKTIERKVGLA